MQKKTGHSPSAAHHPTGSSYEIRLKNHLATCWSAAFEGWSISNLENGEVLLSHPDIDQAGLHGVLNRIRDLNLTLLSVNQIHPKNEENGSECDGY